MLRFCSRVLSFTASSAGSSSPSLPSPSHLTPVWAIPGNVAGLIFRERRRRAFIIPDGAPYGAILNDNSGTVEPASAWISIIDRGQVTLTLTPTLTPLSTDNDGSRLITGRLHPDPIMRRRPSCLKHKFRSGIVTCHNSSIKIAN